VNALPDNLWRRRYLRYIRTPAGRRIRLTIMQEPRTGLWAWHAGGMASSYGHWCALFAKWGAIRNLRRMGYDLS
jgi:hypothetical protein